MNGSAVAQASKTASDRDADEMAQAQHDDACALATA
jgi:hypothetical protein